MSDATFTTRARRLAGLAGITLSWSPDVFWRSTPDELAAVVDVLTDGGGAGAPVDGTLLTQMREAYPDG